jgi:hypothetical protein
MVHFASLMHRTATGIQRRARIVVWEDKGWLKADVVRKRNRELSTVLGLTQVCQLFLQPPYRLKLWIQSDCFQALADLVTISK